MTIDLLAIGLTTLDIALHPVARMPDVDTGVLVPTIRLSPAGTAAGTATVAARLGLRAAIASSVGDDLQGVAVRDGLRRAGVDTTLLATSARCPTSTTVLPVRDDGQRGTLHMVGASMMEPLADGATAAAATARGVHWGGVGSPGLAGQGEPLLRAARAAGAFVTCDLISPQPGAADELARLLPHVDLFMPSLAEVRVLTGGDDLPAAAAHFMALGARACLFKMGRDGAVLFAPEGTIAAPAFAIAPVDTTTCGDSFCAGYHAARLRGFDAPACLRFASAVAARVAMGVGTLGALGSFDETLDFARATAVAA